jgi:hypothetical protein
VERTLSDAATAAAALAAHTRDTHAGRGAGSARLLQLLLVSRGLRRRATGGGRLRLLLVWCTVCRQLLLLLG